MIKGLVNATPSGNGIAVYALQRLGHVLGEPRFLDAAQRALTLFYNTVSRQPSGYTTLLIGLKENLAPPDIVVVRGPAADLAPWQATLNSAYLLRSPSPKRRLSTLGYAAALVVYLP